MTAFFDLIPRSRREVPSWCVSLDRWLRFFCKWLFLKKFNSPDSRSLLCVRSFGCDLTLLVIGYCACGNLRMRMWRNLQHHWTRKKSGRQGEKRKTLWSLQRGSYPNEHCGGRQWLSCTFLSLHRGGIRSRIKRIGQSMKEENGSAKWQQEVTSLTAMTSLRFSSSSLC